MTDKIPELKEVSITPSFTALLKPTADMLGTELRDLVKERIDSAKSARRAANVKSHIDAATQRSSSGANSEPPGVAQLDLFEDWFDHSGDVDPEDRELSLMWESLLVDMGKRKSSSRLLLEKLRELDPDDARTLIKFSGTNREPLSEEDRYRLAKLERLELIEKDESRMAVIQVLLPLSFLAVLSLSFLYVPHISWLAKDGFWFQSASTKTTAITSSLFGLIPAFVLPFAIYVPLVFMFLRRYKKRGLLARFTRRLTWIGHRIVSLGAQPT